MAVTLKNKERRMKAYNLEAPYFVSHRNETKFGKPCAITFLSLEKKEGLPDAILSCAEIAADVQKGKLRVLKQTRPPESPVEELVEEFVEVDDEPSED